MKRAVCLYGVAVLLVCVIIIAGCKPKPENGPDADFEADRTTGTAPLVVQFSDASVPEKAAITTWHWLFGDGAESTLQNPQHVYAAAGTYNVSLEVTTSIGSDTELKLNYITVSTPSAEGEDEGEGEPEGEGEGEGEGEPEPGTIMLPGNVPLVMVQIPAGSFTMGSPASEIDHESDEQQHTVTLNAFWMGKYEFTQAQWKAVMGGANPSYFKGGSYGNTDNRPVESVPWNDLAAFFTALNAHITATGQGSATMRLPSESEWEYACRAGEHVPPTRFYWGDDLSETQIVNYAWYDGNGASQTHDVGGKNENAFGLFDICGNAREWVQDWYHGTYTGAPTDGSAWEVPAGTQRIVRGGSWYTGVSGHRSAYRTYRDPAVGYSYVGFRVVR